MKNLMTQTSLIIKSGGAAHLSLSVDGVNRKAHRVREVGICPLVRFH